jgi:hypothetical protein
MAVHEGSCHCGAIAFTVEGEMSEVVDCNCSMCRRRGALLAAVPRDAIVLKTPESALSTYRFNKHAIDHHFCATCGIAPFSEAASEGGGRMAMVNVRCVPDVDLSKLKVTTFDGAVY